MNKQEIQVECQELFNEIQDLKEMLKWKSNNTLFEKTFIEYIDENGDETEEAQNKYKEKFKKIFQRVSKSLLNKSTLGELEKLKNAIYRCDDYKNSELNHGEISAEIRQHIAKESKKLDKWLLQNDDEK